MSQADANRAIDRAALSWGLIVGFLLGALYTLLKAPRSPQAVREQITETGAALRERIEAALPPDPIAQGLAEGRAAARRRRAELGLSDHD